MEQKEKCNECELCRKMLKASIRQTISELERCLKSKGIPSCEVKGILISLKDSLSICDISPCNYLRKKIKKTFLSNSAKCGELSAGNFSADERAAISIFIAELKAFIDAE